jgi:hypothetical protein
MHWKLARPKRGTFIKESSILGSIPTERMKNFVTKIKHFTIILLLVTIFTRSLRILSPSRVE